MSFGDTAQNEPAYKEIWKYFLVTCLTFLASTFLFVFAIYLIIKIYKFVSFKSDRPLVLSIFSLTLAITCTMTADALDLLSMILSDEN